MNRKQLILIFLALVVVGGASLLLVNHNSDSWSQPQGKMGEKLFPTFALNDVAILHINGGSDLHLARKDGQWRVQERGDYPANFGQIKELLVKVADLKISQSEPIGPSQLARMELEAPGKPAGSGTLVEFKDASGKSSQSVLLGKKHIEESRNPSPFGGGDFANGRYVLRPEDPKEVLLISDALNEVDSKAESWLDKDFFKVENVKSISFTSTNSTNSWVLTRESESAPWVLGDLKAGEVLDSNKVSSVASTLSYASFVDVASNTAPAVTGLDKPLAVSLGTFDQFTYDLKIGNKTPEGNLFLTVNVSGTIPTERTAGKDEKAEDKAKLDKEFKDKTKTLTDKLNQEKMLGKWVYVVSSSVVDPLIRDRNQLFVEKTEEKTEDKTKTEMPAEGATGLPAGLTLPALEPASTNAGPK